MFLKRFVERPHPRLQPRGERPGRRARRGGPPGRTSGRRTRRSSTASRSRRRRRSPRSARRTPSLVVGRISSCSREDVDRAMSAAKGAFAQLVADEPRGAGRDAPAPRRDDARAAVRAPRAPGVRDREGLVRGRRRDRRGDRLLRVLRPARADPLPVPPADAPATEDNCYYYIPLGVGVVVTPWNFPLAILTGMTMAAVVAGNTVVVKPSSDTPILASRLVEMAHEAGVPGRGHQPRPRLRRRDRRLPRHAPGRPVRLVHRLGRRGPADQRDHREARPAAEVDDALRLRDGREERDHRRRDGRPRLRLDRRRPVGLRLPGAEVLGLLAPRRRPARPREARRADRREGEDDPGGQPVGRPVRLHRPRRERGRAQEHPRRDRDREGRGEASPRRPRARPSGLVHRPDDLRRREGRARSSSRKRSSGPSSRSSRSTASTRRSPSRTTRGTA